MKAWRVIFAARKILHQSLCQQKLITVNLRTAPSTSSSLRNLVYSLNASCSADTVVMNYSYVGLCRHEVYIHGPMCDLCWPRPVLCYLSGSSAASSVSCCVHWRRDIAAFVSLTLSLAPRLRQRQYSCCWQQIQAVVVVHSHSQKSFFKFTCIFPPHKV